MGGMGGMEGKPWAYAAIASLLSVLATSFTWMLLTVNMRADIAVLKSNMEDVRNSVRLIEQVIRIEKNK